MSDEVQNEGKETLPEVVSIPKKARELTRETWLQVQLDYETGNFKDLRELCERYKIDYTCLRNKVYKNNWKALKNTTREKVTQLIEKKAESKVERLFSKLEKKAEKYERMVEVSQENLGSRASDGTPLLDPDAIETYAKTESRIIEWHKLALGITDKVQVSGEISVNIVGILEKIRERMRPGVTVDVEAVKEELKGCELIDG